MSRQKILFVSANQYRSPYPVYPIGISYLTTFLEKELPEYDIRTIDFNLHDIKRYIQTLQNYQPHYIGFSLRNIDDVDSSNIKDFTSAYKESIQIARENSNSVIIIGGSGYSIFPEILFNDLEPDFAVVGEGEESLYNLVKCIDENRDYSQIEGLVYRLNGELVTNRRKNYFFDPALKFDNNLIDYYWKNSGMLNIQTKRGCPLDCIYCTYPLIEGRKIRPLNSDNIVEALSYLYEKHGIDYIFFTDSVFNLNREHNLEIAEKIIRSGIRIRWGGYFYPGGMDEEYLKILKRSGLTHIEFGTESISDKTLENYGKHFTVKDILESSALCHKLEIYQAHFIILAGYGETDGSVNETFRNSSRINKTVFFPYVGMRIYPGTRLYDYAMRDGKIKPTDPLLESRYFISDQVDLKSIKDRAKTTGKNWVFPDQDNTEIIRKLRILKNKKGPLWEYLIT